jgi:D-alanyl-D-alanine carboxypeptidase/D-alanyl-D-alanine-endopeptidase (penicillin-binding protein 4)
MKRMFFNVVCLLLFTGCFGQNMSQRVEKAYQQFEADSQLRHAISSLYIINAKTGEVVFDRNSQIGLAPASTQKIVTAATAFELLGKDYRYKTCFKLFHAELGISGAGDPTLGSWRFSATRDTALFREIIGGVRKKGITSVREIFSWNNEQPKKIPSGWIYEDIANYYGAAPYNINWHENQYDIVFIPGKNVGDRAEIDTALTSVWGFISNDCKTGPRGSGDNAYLYYLPDERRVLVQGTVPAGVSRFTISGAHKMPGCWFVMSFAQYAIATGFVKNDSAGTYCTDRPLSRVSASQQGDGLHWGYDSSFITNPDYIHYSPSMDSIVYWFLQKSINLYGEALIKTFPYEKKGFGTTEDGVAIVKDFWKQKGLDDEELNIIDGSGLSPQNRVTTHAQVEILKYAKTREWFPYFYQALPTYNGMKMKSGSIRDVKGYCGYQQSSDGNEYIFSFLVNNYSGRSSMVVNKMYNVLDVLK